jgi:xylulokinase
MFLGLDIGTSGVKAVVLDERDAIVAQATAPLAVSRPFPAWAEQAPDDWWEAASAAVLGLDPAIRRGVSAIGLAGQMHGATLLDAADRPVRPAILWNDGRSYAECELLERLVPESRAITGNLAMPGFTAPKLLWVREHEPHHFRATRRVLLPKDYVRLCMTGDAASDMSDSAGTLWLDVARRSWSAEMLAACDLDLSAMPSLSEGTEPTGVLRAAIAEAWGMRCVPVAAGGGDNAAGAVGVGIVGEGDGLLSLGTSGVIFVATEAFRPNPAGAVHAFCHCLPGMWHQMSVHLNAAASVDWADRLIGAGGPGAFFELAQSAGPDAGPELFLPYLSGERTPHNDPHVRGAFLRLDNDTDRARLAQAVLEGVAFALADGLDALEAAGTKIGELAVIGGGARSTYWGSIISAVLDRPLVYLGGGEVGPALGAARLARIAVEQGATDIRCSRPLAPHRIEPGPIVRDRLLGKRGLFRAAYSQITSDGVPS